MTIANWNPNLSIPPGTSNATLNGYLTAPWAGGVAPTPPPLTGVLFIAGNSNGFFSSVDGQTWVQSAIPAPNPAQPVFQIIWSSAYSAWFANSASGTTGYFATSTDGLTWTALTPLTGSIGPYVYIAALGTTLWTMDQNGRSQRSTDGGITWALGVSVPIAVSYQLAAQNGTALLSSENVGVASIFNTTTDGVTLTSVTVPNNSLIAVSQPHGVCISAGLYCVLTNALANNASGILTSPTGATGTWTSYSTPASMALKTLATIAGNGSGTWILLALDGTAAYSTDNMATWNNMASLANRPYRINYSATLGLFVVGGDNGIPALLITANPALGWSTPTTLPAGSTVIEDIGVRG